MKISTKGKYALEIVVDLAVSADADHPQSLKNIAYRRNLSVKYLERIIKLLKEKGVVTSVRGVSGGYCLAKAPENITALEVLQATEGMLAPVDCLIDHGKCDMKCKVCSTKNVWDDMWKLIQSTAQKITIKQIAERAAEKTL